MGRSSAVPNPASNQSPPEGEPVSAAGARIPKSAEQRLAARKGRSAANYTDGVQQRPWPLAVTLGNVDGSSAHAAQLRETGMAG